MTGHLRGRVVASTLLAPLLVTLAACGGSSSGGSPSGGEETQAGGTAAACPSDISKTASTPLPSDVPTPEGASSAYDYFPQGATKVWYFAIAGSPSELPSLRDAYDNTLKSKGYKIHDTDQESNSEAESEFGGPHHGTTNFRPLCDGKVVFRLKLTS
jgi:hypothetical protein